MNPYSEQNATNAMLKDKAAPAPTMKATLDVGERYRPGSAGGVEFRLDTIGRESSCDCGGNGRALCDHLRAGMLAHLQNS